MGEIAEFIKSDCRVDIVAHHGFTGVHIASVYAPNGFFYQFLPKGWVTLNTGLYRLFEITCKCHIFIFLVFCAVYNLTIELSCASLTKLLED